MHIPCGSNQLGLARSKSKKLTLTWGFCWASRRAQSPSPAWSTLGFECWPRALEALSAPYPAQPYFQACFFWPHSQAACSTWSQHLSQEKEGSLLPIIHTLAQHCMGGWKEALGNHHGRGKSVGPRGRSEPRCSTGSAEPSWPLGHNSQSAWLQSAKDVCIQQSKQRHAISKCMSKITNKDNRNNREGGVWERGPPTAGFFEWQVAGCAGCPLGPCWELAAMCGTKDLKTVKAERGQDPKAQSRPLSALQSVSSTTNFPSCF